MIAELRCTNCLAPLQPELASGGVVSCAYCRTVLRVSGFGGSLLAAVDFSDPRMPGWVSPLDKEKQFLPGPPPELLTRLGATQGAWNVLVSSATFDDFDLGLNVRLLWGDLTTTRAGLSFRRTPAGFYRVGIRTDGAFAFQYIDGEYNQKTLISTRHDAVRTEPGALNQMRVVCSGDRMRVLLNGVQVAALRDQAASFGTIGIFATAEVPMAVAFSALTVRAVEGEPERPAQMAGTFDVVLRRLGNAKIMAIKAVREATGIGLKEAKDLVETANARLLVGGSQANAERLVEDLRRIGCEVEMRRSR